MYISFLNEDIRPGYKNKIHSQAKSFVDLGFDSKLFIVKNYCLCLYSFDKNRNETIEREYQFLKKRSRKERNIKDEFVLFKQFVKITQEIVKEKKVNVVYIRRIVPITPKLLYLVSALKNSGVYVIYEYPTWPWKNEIISKKNKKIRDYCFYFLDSFLYKKLIKNINLLTYIGECNIRNKKFMKIINCIDIDNYPLHQQPQSETIHLIGVAHVAYYHGYDKIILGLKKYYEKKQSRKVIFDIVGNVDPALGLEKIVEKFNLDECVRFHGFKKDKELDLLFEISNIGVNSLSIEEVLKNVKGITTLKTGEYTARGLPQIGQKPFELANGKIEKPEFLYIIEQDKEYVDIEKVVEFYDSLSITAKDIRDYGRLKLSWQLTFKPIIDKYQIDIKKNKKE